MKMKVETMKTDTGTVMERRRLVLNSKNSVAVKEMMEQVSKDLMKKHEALYRRLATK